MLIGSTAFCYFLKTILVVPPLYAHPRSSGSAAEGITKEQPTRPCLHDWHWNQTGERSLQADENRDSLSSLPNSQQIKLQVAICTEMFCFNCRKFNTTISWSTVNYTLVNQLLLFLLFGWFWINSLKSYRLRSFWNCDRILKMHGWCILPSITCELLLL